MIEAALSRQSFIEKPFKHVRAKGVLAWQPFFRRIPEDEHLLTKR